jgi:hypothetical protein
MSPPVSEPLTNRGVLLSTLLHAIIHPSHHLLNVLLQTANKLGLPNKKNIHYEYTFIIILYNNSIYYYIYDEK